jgi:hypothetical protein
MYHGAWKALPRGYIFLCKESVIEAQRNAYYIEMFFFHVVGYPYLQKCIVIVEKDVPYDQKFDAFFVITDTARFVMLRFFCSLSIIRNVTVQY